MADVGKNSRIRDEAVSQIPVLGRARSRSGMLRPR